jgi:hypothetical protein
VLGADGRAAQEPIIPATVSHQALSSPGQIEVAHFASMPLASMATLSAVVDLLHTVRGRGSGACAR